MSPFLRKPQTICERDSNGVWQRSPWYLPRTIEISLRVSKQIRPGSLLGMVEFFTDTSVELPNMSSRLIIRHTENNLQLKRELN